MKPIERKLQEDITPFDVVAGVIYFFGEDKPFPTNYEKLHRTFYAEKNNPFLKEFRFREGGPYPYSELLESVFSRLAISGLLGCQNPDYRQFITNKRQLNEIRRSSLRKFSKEGQQELKFLSLQIQRKLK
jgi:hypothetical protein